MSRQPNPSKRLALSPLVNPLWCIPLLVLMACQHLPTKQASKDASQSVHSGAAFACPSTDFSAFFAAFAENTAIQRRYIAVPLKQMTLKREAEPEPTPVVRMLNGPEISFPVIPDAAQRKTRSLGLRVDTVLGSEAKASLYAGDADYLVYYIFDKADACWRLVGIEDWSL